MDLLYQWLTHRPIDLLYQWSVRYPFSTLAYIIHTRPMIFYFHGLIDLLCQWSVLFPGLHPPT